MQRLASLLVIALAVGCNSSGEPSEPSSANAAESAAPAEKPSEQIKDESVEPSADEPAEPAAKKAELMSIEAPADVAAPPADADKSESGLAWKVLRPGTGSVHPTRADRVTVHYVGWTTDGKRFDSSIERGEPAEFPVGRVIPGWTEGLQLMVEGERRRFWIPANLAYGEHPPDPRMPAGMLVFDVELIRIN